jgi:outer membrane protein assembly factor BamB
VVREEAYVADGTGLVHVGKRLDRLVRFLLAPLLLALGALLGGCGGPASTVFNRAAALSQNARVIYLASTSVVGLRGTDGADAWRMTNGLDASVPASGVVSDAGVVYIGTTPTPTPPQPAVGAPILALRVADGTPVWRASLPSVDPATGFSFGYSLALAPDRAVLLAASQGSGIYALDPGDGPVRWHVAAHILGAPLLVGSTALVRTETDAASYMVSGIAAYRESDGALLWQNPSTGMIFANRLGIYTDARDDMTALSVQDGHALWTFQPNDSAASEWSSLIGADDQSVLVQVTVPARSPTDASNDYLRSLDADTGHFKWTFSPGVALTAPAATGTPLFAATSDSSTMYVVFDTLRSGEYHTMLMALRSADGVKLWQVDYSPFHVLQISVVDGVVFALLSQQHSSSICFKTLCQDGDRRLQAIDGASGTVYWERDIPDAMVLARGKDAACCWHW